MVEFFILITPLIVWTQIVISVLRFLMSQIERHRTCNDSLFAHCLSQFLQRVSEIIFTALWKYGDL